MEYKIPAKLVEEIGNYLVSRPYKEVHHLVAAILKAEPVEEETEEGKDAPEAS